MGWNALHLGRAAFEQSRGNYPGVVENLEAIDFSSDSAFADADRAAFLLGQAYLQLGSRERFAILERQVSAWGRRTPYTQWLAYQRLLDAREIGPASGAAGGAASTDSLDPRAAARDAGVGAANALAASLLLESGDTEDALRLASGSDAASALLADYVRVLALEASGKDVDAELARLSTADTVSTLGRDLAGAAILRRAARGVARHEDPRPLLETVPIASRYASRARHMRGLIALERGETAEGRRILESVLASDTTYAGRREVALALAACDLDSSRWDAARGRYETIATEWARRRQALEQLLARGDFDPLWASWESGASVSDGLLLDGVPTDALAMQLATESANLAAHPTRDVPPLMTRAPAGAGPVATDSLSANALSIDVAPPVAAAWNQVARSARRRDEAAYARDRAREALDRELVRLADRQHYLGIGQDRARNEDAALRGQLAVLDSLRGRLKALDAQLVAVRDDARRSIVQRTLAIIDQGQRSLVWMHAMRHLYLEGPNLERPVRYPPGIPSADSLLTVEESLTREVQAYAESLRVTVPGLIARSYASAWRPGLIDRATTLRLMASQHLVWVQGITVSIDSSLAAAATSPELHRLEQRAAALAKTSDSLVAAHDALRARVAGEAVQHAVAALDSEQEAIDYGAAVSTYALSVHLAAGDSTGGAATHDSAGVAADLDDPATAAWRGPAIDALRGFLERHPQSFARGEMRFRLADLLLVDAREKFRDQMAVYVKAQAEGEAVGPPPVLNQAAALQLYQSILHEDRDFAHLDAVLFNAGMLQADEGSPDAMRYFADLVASHPESRYRQEAYLRMGDMQFNDRAFDACVALYDSAAAGPDPGLQAIALYKMGWAHFNQDRFLQAADAFRSVLDVYGSANRDAIHVSIEPEAEDYLINTLAQAGGADAFASYFDRIGKRPYERRVLLAMGQHFRRFSLYEQAAAVDTLAIARYPLDPDALVSARRLTETYQRWDRPILARRAMLEYAPRFEPQSAWAKAQTSDSVRTAGAEFAESCWLTVARYHHLEARKSGSAEDWRAALDLYQKLISRWPNHPEAASFQLYSGEASAKLGDYPGALTHYAAAAASGPDSVAEQALRQRVAVTDAWYEKSRARTSTGATALGSDTLAKAVLETGDALLTRFPGNAAAADVMWREGNLALAHGWSDRAIQDFDKLATRFPDDKRTPMAAGLRANALFQAGKYEEAGAAFETALGAAQRAGSDTLAKRAAAAIPVCYFKFAETVATTDSTNYTRQAQLFEKVASRWPQYEHAHLAQYRAGLAYLKAGSTREGVLAMQALIRNFPNSPYVKDAHLNIAKAWETGGDKEKAADAYAEFADRYPKDESAADAWLKAADLYAAAGLVQRADQLRLAYIKKFPNDIETAMEILEGLARRDLATVTPQHPISTLLPPPAPKSTSKKGASTKKATAATKSAVATVTPPSYLAEYLKRADANPKLASRDLIAQVRFLQGEEARGTFLATRFTQPLEKSIPVKQKQLDNVLKRYRETADMGVAKWANAAAYRIGETLVGFGAGLEKSDRPADLTGDDLEGYLDVIHQQAQGFYDQGEGVWSDLLRQKGHDSPDDEWVHKAQASLWSRLADRFFYRPEVEFPLVEGSAPDRKPAERGRPSTELQSSDSGRKTPEYSHREDER